MLPEAIVGCTEMAVMYHVVAWFHVSVLELYLSRFRLHGYFFLS